MAVDITDSSIRECTCTAAYFCPDENQWEPGYMCQKCIDEQYQNMNDIENMTGQLMQTPVIGPIPEDDLPF